MDGATIILILNILLGVFCLLGFLIGFIRGVRKAGLRLLVFALFLGIILLITPAVSNLVAGIKLSFLENMSVQDYLSTQISNDPSIAEFMNEVPVLQAYANQLPTLVLNLLVYVLLLYIVGFVGLILYSIVAKIVFKKNKEKKHNYKNPKITLPNQSNQLQQIDTKKQKKHRLLGGAVGAIQAFILLIATFVPVSGLLNIATSAIYKDTVSASEESSDVSPYTALGDYLLEEGVLTHETLSYLDLYSKSIIGKSSHILGADTLVFDSIAKIRVDGEKIALRQEILCISEALDEAEFLLEFLSNSENFKIENITVEQYERLEKAVDKLLELKTIKVVIPELLPYAIKKIDIPEVQGIDISNNVNRLIELMCNKKDFISNLKSDIKAVINILKVLKQNDIISLLNAEEIDTDAVIQKLKLDKNSDDQAYDVAFELFDYALNSKTFRNAISEAVNVGLEIAENEINKLKAEKVTNEIIIAKIDTKNVDWNNQKENFKEILKNALIIYDTIDLDELKSFNDIYKFDYKTVINSACSAINKLINSPLFEAGENGVDVYDSLMTGLNQTKYGEYINFSSTANDDFWSQNSQLFSDALDYYEEYIDYDDISTIIDDLDYDTLESLISRLLDSSIVNCFKSNIFEYACKLIPESVYAGQFGESIEGTVNKIIDELIENNTTLGGMKQDVIAMYHIVREVIENDLIDTFKTSPLNVTEVFELISKEDSNQKNIADRLVEYFLSAPNTKRIFIDVLNLGESIAEIKIEELTQTDLELTLISADDVEWGNFEAELKEIFDTILSVEFLEESMTLNFQGEEINIPVDIPSSIEKAGKVLDLIKNLEVFNYEGGNIIDDVLLNLNTKYSEYLDFSALVGESSVSNQFEAIKAIAESLINSGVITDLSDKQFNLNDVDLCSLLGKFSSTFEDKEGIERSYINAIVTTLLENNLVKPTLKYGINHVNDNLMTNIAENISNISDKEVKLIINTDAIDDENCKANIVAFFDNFASYLKTVEYQQLKDDPVKTILSSNLTLVGSLLDNIKSNGLFDECVVDGEDYEGLYASLMGALSESEYNQFINFDVVTSNDFTWNSELSALQSAINAVLEKEITFIKDELPVTKSLYDFIKDDEDVSILIDYFTSEDVNNIIQPMISSELFVPSVKLLINFGIDEINKVINNPQNSINYIATYEHFNEQKDEIIDIIQSLLNIAKLDSYELSKVNNVIIGSAMNSLNKNANRISGDGVFKEVYNGLISYLQTLENGDKLQVLLNEYTDPLNVEWIELLNMAIEYETLFDGSNKERLQALFARVYDDNEYGVISGHLYDIYTSMTDENADSLNVLTSVNGLRLLSNCNKDKTLNFIEFVGEFTGNSTLLKLKGYDVTNLNNLAVLTAFNNHKENIDSIDNAISLLDDLIEINDSTAIDTTIDFANQFVTIQGLTKLKGLNLSSEKEKLASINSNIDSLSIESNQEDIDIIVLSLSQSEIIMNMLPDSSVNLPDTLDSMVISSIETQLDDELAKTKVKAILGL